MCWSLPQMLVATVRRTTPCGTLRPTLAGFTPGPSCSSNSGYSRSATSTLPGPMYRTPLLLPATLPASRPCRPGPGRPSLPHPRRAARTSCCSVRTSGSTACRPGTPPTASATDQVGCAGIPRSLTRHPAISPWAPGAGSAAASSADRGRASTSVPTTSGTRRQDRLTSTGAPWRGTSVARNCLAPPMVPADDRRQWPGPAGRAVPACGDVAWPVVLVLLPPSETKAPGGDSGPLDLAALTAPELTPVRTELLEALVKLSADPPTARTALGLSPRQDDEIARNADLWTAPTRPAIERYTGVLYDALDVRSLSRAQRARADRRLAVGSALFGLVSAAVPIPASRLSAGSTLPGMPGLRALWRPALSPVLAGLDHLVVDLRSGSYAALAPVPGAVTVQILSEHPDGTRAVVSHFNKAHKGRLARLLATTTAEPQDVVRLRALLRRSGLHVEHDGGAALTLVVPSAGPGGRAAATP